MRFGALDSVTPKTSPSECAGSVETRRTRRAFARRGAGGATADASAKAEAHVVLPTPPLPPKNTNLELKT
jgi:hypothetical protein